MLFSFLFLFFCIFLQYYTERFLVVGFEFCGLDCSLILVANFVSNFFLSIGVGLNVVADFGKCFMGLINFTETLDMLMYYVRKRKPAHVANRHEQPYSDSRK